MKYHKTFLNLVAGSFLLAAIILLFGKEDWFPDFYNPRYMGMMAFFSIFALNLPRFVFRADNDDFKLREVNRLQISFALLLILNGLGSLGLYKLYEIGLQYDKLLHFLSSAILLFTFSRFSQAWFGFSLKKSIFVSVFLVFSLGIVWEFFEFFSDAVFGTQTMGEYGQYVLSDTIFDLACNTWGILFSFVLIFLKSSKRTEQIIKMKLKSGI